MSKNRKDLADLLREAGLKSTPARRAILESFPKGCHPLSAENIYAKVGTRNIDQATVYRNLASLEEAGLIRKVDLHADAAHYELSHGHHHHHIVCMRCGAVESLEACGVESIARQALAVSKRFREIRDHSLELFGICKSCEAS